MKTPEEIRKALECCSKSVCRIDCMDLECPYVTRYGHDCMNRMAADALEYIQSLEKEIAEHDLLEDHIRDLTKMMPEWVSVKERLPENAQSCIVITGFQPPDVCVATYYEISSRGNPNGDWIFDDGDGWLDTVAAVYWMPLPDLPREDCNE